MGSGWLLLAAIASSGCGMGFIALAMAAHWQQVRRAAPLTPASAFKLRALGALALGASLLFCLRADHASMAFIVWVMALTASALVIALTLAWRPSWLAWLVSWLD